MGFHIYRRKLLNLGQRWVGLADVICLGSCSWSGKRTTSFFLYIIPLTGTCFQEIRPQIYHSSTCQNAQNSFIGYLNKLRQSIAVPLNAKISMDSAERSSSVSLLLAKNG